MRTCMFTLLAVLGMAQAATAQGGGLGEEVFGQYCATCHGTDARGDGPMAPILLLKPANLRRLSAMNEGVFPTIRVVRQIDGRDPLVAHGSMMPVYGYVFEGEDTPLKAENGQPIMTSRIIVDLVDYLKELQE